MSIVEKANIVTVRSLHYILKFPLRINTSTTGTVKSFITFLTPSEIICNCTGGEI